MSLYTAPPGGGGSGTQDVDVVGNDVGLALDSTSQSMFGQLVSIEGTSAATSDSTNDTYLVALELYNLIRGTLEVQTTTVVVTAAGASLSAFAANLQTVLRGLPGQSITNISIAPDGLGGYVAIIVYNN